MTLSLGPQNKPTRRQLLSRIYPKSPRTFQIRLCGNEGNARLLERAVKRLGVIGTDVAPKGPRYHREGGYFVANALDRGLVKKLRKILFKLGDENTVTWLAVAHEKTYATFNVRSDPEQYFAKFLKDPRKFIFVPFSKVIVGCLKMLNNAEQLARFALESKSPRFAFLLVSYAFEELGKAALLVRSHSFSLKNRLSVVVIEGFNEHESKLDLIMDEVLGSFKEIRNLPQGELKDFGEFRTVGRSLFVKENGIIDRFRRSLRMLGTGDELWPHYNPALDHLLDSLAEYGTLERERCIYVDYNTDIAEWREPGTQFDIRDSWHASRIVLEIVSVYRPILESIGQLPQSIVKFGDIINVGT